MSKSERADPGDSRSDDDAEVSPTPAAAQLGLTPNVAFQSATELRSIFEEFGLSSNEAVALVVLMQMGTASAGQVARTSGLSRPNIYRELQSLQDKGLIDVVPGETKLWVSPGRDEVINRLAARQETLHQRLRERELRARELTVSLAAVQEASVRAQPVCILRSVNEQIAQYERLIQSAKREVLVLNRGPYQGGLGTPQPGVVDAIGRGVRIRALFEEAQLAAPGLAGLLAEAAAYEELGVDQGVVAEQFCLGLAVFDRRSVLILLEITSLGESSSIPLHVEHSGLADAMAIVFEHYWARSVPLTGARSGQTCAASTF